LFSISSFKLDYYLLPAMPAAALLVGRFVGSAHKLPIAMRRIVAGFTILTSLVVLAIALFSLQAAGALQAQTVFRFLPPALALLGTGAIVVCIVRRQTWPAVMTLMATIWATILSLQLTLMPYFVHYLPATRLAANVPIDSVLYTSWEASGWANDFAFILTSGHRVERLIGDGNNEKLLAVLNSDPKAVAVLFEREYLQLAEKNPDWRILAAAETFGRGGLNWNKVSNPRRDRLLLIGRAH
jgi:4-amino-4-deoxy-L-arabinose transferase-like glycosyltransferase